MGHYELITACFFFGKLALKNPFFEVHTPKFADPPPIVHIMCEVFYIFLVASHNTKYPKMSVEKSELSIE